MIRRGAHVSAGCAAVLAVVLVSCAGPKKVGLGNSPPVYIAVAGILGALALLLMFAVN